MNNQGPGLIIYAGRIYHEMVERITACKISVVEELLSIRKGRIIYLRINLLICNVIEKLEEDH
jgi:hypothetical protein